jgi:hypothetical protein
MNKSVPVEVINFSTLGSAAFSLRLSTDVPYAYESKQGTAECCVILHLSALTGTSPTFELDVYETVDGADIRVGTTGVMSAPDDRVIDSGGGTTSSGMTFASGTNTGTLRLLGKGTDMVLKGTTSGTIGTIAATVNVMFYP